MFYRPLPRTVLWQGQRVSRGQQCGAVRVPETLQKAPEGRVWLRRQAVRQPL